MPRTASTPQILDDRSKLGNGQIYNKPQDSFFSIGQNDRYICQVSRGEK